ncbi:MAG: copper transporter [Nostocoides sp.]
MIDFRYHLVSIVSVFMALAIGIVLGAGPLKGQLGDTITKDVTTLRADKAALSQQLADADKAVASRDEYTAATMKTVLVGRLAGVRVDLIELPGADTTLVRSVRSTLASAGATTGDTITISEDWASTDAEVASKRQHVATQLAEQLGVAAADAEDRPLLDEVLATLLRQDTSQESRNDAFRELSDGGLLSVDTSAPGGADAAVVVGGVVSEESIKAGTATARQLAYIGTAVDRAGVATVIATNEAIEEPPSGSIGLIAVIRDDTILSRDISTVDDASPPMGQGSIVMALILEQAGTSGQYGQGPGASAPFPAVKGLSQP